MAGLDPAIHLSWKKALQKTMDARVKPAHDGAKLVMVQALHRVRDTHIP
jgi:hypothetical protein